MLPAHLRAVFEEIYRTELVYRPDCWQLCGDAHCCNFGRYKSRFRLLAKGGHHDLPLLPGEFDFLASQGWERQFGEFERHQTRYDFGNGAVVLDMVSSLRPGCVCEHATRTVICRLYPLLPAFDVDGHLVGTEPMGVYDELERLDALEPACQLTSIPFAQLQLFLRICELLASSPALLFHIAAYRATKRHLFERLRPAKETTGKSAFALFEGAYLRSRLIDHAQLKAELAALKTAFDARYGARFAAEMAALQAPAEAPAPEAS